MRKLDFSRKLLLGAVGLAAVVVPVAFGLLHAAQTRTASQTLNEANVYEIVSIKENKTGTRQVWLRFLPTGLTATNVKVRTLIRFAYDVEDDRLLAEPSWLDANGYDIEAKLDSSVSEALAELSEDQRALEGRRMLQVLLAERFKLIVHRETKELPVYSLVIASTGPKVQDAKPGDTYPNGFVFDGHPAGHGIWLEGNKLMGQKIMGQGVPMSTLAHTLSPVLRHTIVDKTGLTGNFDFTLQWTPGEGQTAILAAIQEQLGLKLESQAAPVEILVIDHVEKPSEY